jgi:four helix bundle protein
MAPTANSEAIQNRTKQLALIVIRLSRRLPQSPEARIIGRQLLRSATSVAANYRAVCRARSTADFISKLGVVLEEADETLFWLELLVDAGVVLPAQIEPALMKRIS